MQVWMQLFYIGLCACCFLCLYRIGRGPWKRRIARCGATGASREKTEIHSVREILRFICMGHLTSCFEQRSVASIALALSWPIGYSSGCSAGFSSQATPCVRISCGRLKRTATDPITNLWCNVKSERAGDVVPH